MSDRRYLLAGEPVEVLIRPYEKRADLPSNPRFPLPRLRPYSPRNVLIRRADGSLDVRPFRGLRKAHA